jgi:hypothetical protein
MAKKKNTIEYIRHTKATHKLRKYNPTVPRAIRANIKNKWSTDL